MTSSSSVTAVGIQFPKKMRTRRPQIQRKMAPSPGLKKTSNSSICQTMTMMFHLQLRPLYPLRLRCRLRYPHHRHCRKKSNALTLTTEPLELNRWLLFLICKGKCTRILLTPSSCYVT